MSMLSLDSIPIPSRMQHLRRDDRGYPVFFTLGDDIQFKGIHPERVQQCVNELLCGICGKSMKTQIYKLWLPGAFIGGAYSGFISHCFTDPLMHQECAEYASLVCPWMVMQNYKRIADRDTFVMHESGVDLRPKVFTMISSVGFKMYKDGLFRANRPRILKVWKPGSNDTPTDQEIQDYLKEVEQALIEKSQAQLT